MTFDVMKIIWALVIAVGWIILGWLFGLIGGTVGMFLSQVLMLPWIFGLYYYANKDVKGMTNGFVTGLVFGLVFAIVQIIFYYIAWTGAGVFPFLGFDGNYGTFFGWPGMWAELIGIILLGGCIGWVNESK